MAKNSEKLSVGLVFDDTLDSNDGVSQQVKRLGEYLVANGHKVVYLCGETKIKEYAGGKVYSLAKNLSVKFNGNRLTMPIYSSRRVIKNVLKTEALDIVYVTVPYSPFLGQRIIAAADRSGVAVVGAFHILPSGWVSSLGARLLGLVQFFSLKRFGAFTSTSKSAAKFAQKTMRIRSSVVPNMVDIKYFEPGRRVGNEPGRIVFLGRLVKRKGCAELIDAFSVLAKSRQDAQLIIAGDGPERQKLETQVHRLGLGDKVKFLGYIDEQDKPQVLGSAEIACFPSLYGESFGVVLIEAMAAGAGVVLAGDNPGYRCVMEEQPQLLVNPADKEELASRLERLLGNEALRADLHKWQLQSVQQYDTGVVGEQILKLCRQAIAINKQNRHN